jgi:hypothetical protein
MRYGFVVLMICVVSMLITITGYNNTVNAGSEQVLTVPGPSYYLTDHLTGEIGPQQDHLYSSTTDTLTVDYRNLVPNSSNTEMVVIPSSDEHDKKVFRKRIIETRVWEFDIVISTNSVSQRQVPRTETTY